MPLKDEQIVIIAPGSQTTLAQLGIQESIAPASLRIRSCMFPGERDGEWEPFKVQEKAPKPKAPVEPNGEPVGVQVQEPETEYFEDFESEEGAVWPMVQGRITNWPGFFALLSYVHKRLSPHLHSPILLVAQPCWTTRDYEKLTQFFFEKFKPPGFVIVDSALTSLWAYNTANSCVVDVGYQKTDVTAITEYSVNVPGRGFALPGVGGDAFTQKLLELLDDKGFNLSMCEQLKQNSICEILPSGVPLPGGSDSPSEEITNPAAAASTGAVGSGPGQRHNAGALGDAPLGPGPGTEVGEEPSGPVEVDGVLDVASIVAAGNKKVEEFISKKEQEKQKKGRGAASQAPPKPVKLRNADKEKATFSYEEVAPPETDTNGSAANGGEAENGTEKKPTKIKKEIYVGVERFQANSGGTIERIADAIFLAISSVDDIAKRSECWENLIVVGNGAKIRGFREYLLSFIQRKYVISPSSATIFTSELPSQLTTPTGTGANTPQPQYNPPGPGSSVNPLLVAAVTSQTQHLAPNPQMPSAHTQNMHSSHGQTPTNVKFTKIGEYFPEWKEVGYDEAQFLGAQVMAKVLFVVDQGTSKGFMNRSDYNEMGPSGIVEFGP